VHLQNCEKLAISFVMSVRLSVCLSTWNNSATSGQIFMKSDVIFFKSGKKIKNLKRITGTLHQCFSTFV